MEIVKITDETFESIEKYLNILAASVGSFKNLSYVTTDNGLYMICPLETDEEKYSEDGLSSFAIVKNDGKELKDYCLSLDKNGNIFKLISGRTLYVFDENNKVTYKQDLLTHYSEHLAYREHTNGANVLYYGQRNPLMGVSCLQQYIVNEGGHSLETYLPYLSKKYPNIMTVEQLSSLLGFMVYNKNKTYIKTKDNDYVRGIKLPFTNGYYGFGITGIPLDDILGDKPLNQHVPDDIVSLYTNKEKMVGDVEEVAKVYKKELLSKK